MKRFRFSLETVKTYKDQLLENLKTEYSLRVSLVIQQELKLEELLEQKRQVQQERNRKASQGISVRDHSQYELYVNRLQHQIRQEQEKLEFLMQQAEEKRKEMVEMKKETTTLERLREKKKEEYDHKEAKAQELFIEEFATRNMLK